MSSEQNTFYTLNMSLYFKSVMINSLLSIYSYLSNLACAVNPHYKTQVAGDLELFVNHSSNADRLAGRIIAQNIGLVSLTHTKMTSSIFNPQDSEHLDQESVS